MKLLRVCLTTYLFCCVKRKEKWYINLVGISDDLNCIDRVRLAIYLLKESYFSTEYDENFIKLLKEVLEILNHDSKNVIISFTKYKNLLFISSKYI